MTETSGTQSSLSTVHLAELQSLVGLMGPKGISRMRKSEFVVAIHEACGSSASTLDSHSMSKGSPGAGTINAVGSSPSASATSEPTPEQPPTAAPGRFRHCCVTAASGVPEEC